MNLRVVIAIFINGDGVYSLRDLILKGIQTRMKEDIKKGHLKVGVTVNSKKPIIKTKEYEDTITA